MPLVWFTGYMYRMVGIRGIELRLHQRMRTLGGTAVEFKEHQGRYPTNLHDVAANGWPQSRTYARAILADPYGYGDEHMIEPTNGGVRIVIRSGRSLLLPRLEVSHTFTQYPDPTVPTNPYGTGRRVRR